MEKHMATGKGAIRRMSMKMMNGGPIKGPGTGTSDDVPIMASHGEFMVKAAAVKKIGLPALEAINAMGDTPKGAVKKMSNVAHMAEGGLVDEEARRAALLAQIPTTPDPSRTESTNPVVGTDFSRNVGNTLSSLSGAAPIIGAVRGLAGASRVGTALDAVGGGAGALAAKVGPYLPVAGLGAAAISSRPDAIAAPALPVSAATRFAGDATMPGQDPGRRLSTASPDGSYSLSGVAGRDVGGGVQRYDVPGKSPLFTNLTGEAGRISNEALMARGPISKQNQGALDGIQARQDAGDRAAANKYQYDQEVASATAARGSATGLDAQLQSVMRAYADPNRPAGTGKELRTQIQTLMEMSNNQAGNATRMRGQDLDAAHQSATAKLAQQKWGTESVGVGLDNQRKAGTEALRAKWQAETDPVKKATLESDYRVAMGHAERNFANKFTAVPEFDGNGMRTGTTVLDSEGNVVNTKPQAQQTPTPATIDKLKANKNNPQAKTEFIQLFGQKAYDQATGAK